MNLSLQRINLCDRDLLCEDLGNPILPWIVNSFSKRDLLSEIVDGERTIRQKDPSPPDFLLGDSACSHIYFTSVFEFDPGIGNIRVRSENGNAHGIDFSHL